jgi:hypothetical protein
MESRSLEAAAVDGLDPVEGYAYVTLGSIGSDEQLFIGDLPYDGAESPTVPDTPGMIKMSSYSVVVGDAFQLSG